MEKLSIAILLLGMISCKTIKTINNAGAQFQTNESVYVGSEKFIIVKFKETTNEYILEKPFGGFYEVKASEVTKTINLSPIVSLRKSDFRRLRVYDE